jgi:ribosomal protein S18 acetylase RimI-like enzyme
MIRIANLNDIPIINNICNSNQALVSTKDDADYTSWLTAHVNSDSLFYVYEIDNSVVGFILSEKLVHNGLMVWMSGVFDKYNGKGIGIKLYEYTEKKSREINIKWMLCYGYVDNNVVNRILINKGYETNGNIYNEYFKFL